MDSLVKKICTSTENCRRKMLLKSVGSRECFSTSSSSSSSSDSPCCDVCDPSMLEHIVSLKTSVPPARKTRCQRVRVVSSDQDESLKEILAKKYVFIQRHPSFEMLGPEFVLSSAVISAISKDAPFIDSIDYIKEHYGIRPELCDELFTAIESVISKQSASKQPCIT